MNTSSIKISLTNSPLTLKVLQGVIVWRDQFTCSGNGGSTPDFIGSATTTGGRGVAVEVQGGRDGWSGTITLSYPLGRQGYGLLQTIVGELLQEEGEAYGEEMPPPPDSWEGLGVVEEGADIPFGWVRSLTDHSLTYATVGRWFWVAI